MAYSAKLKKKILDLGEERLYSKVLYSDYDASYYSDKCLKSQVQNTFFYREE